MSDFVYVGGRGPQTVKKLRKSDLAEVAESANYGGEIRDLLPEDAGFVYVGGLVHRTVKKLRKSDLAEVAESANYGGDILALAEDADFVYVGGWVTQTVKKLRKSDLAEVDESANYGGDIQALAEDENFVYVCGKAVQTVKKLQKSDLAQVAESANYGGIPNALIEDIDFVYVGGGTTHTVRKLRKSDLVEVAISASYGTTIYDLGEDADFIYVAGYQTIQTVKKLQKSDLVEVAESAPYGQNINALTEAANFVYIGGSVTQTVKKLRKSDLAEVAESANYGGDIFALAATPIVLPTITTDPATAVEEETATGNGNITDNGGEDCDKRGFVYNTSPHGNPGDTAPADSEYAHYVEETDTFGIGAFTGALTSLDPNTLYYVRAYAHNSAGYSYGNEVLFTTLAAIPAVITDPATSVINNAALLNGILTDDGGEACTCGFEWGETDAYGNTTPTQSRTTGQTFSQIISGLLPGTTYHFRAFATNSAGTGYSADRSFTTLPPFIINRAYALSRKEL